MKFEMSENSVFAILLRSHWWISFCVAAGIVALSIVALPARYVIFGAVGALPFTVIGLIVLWRQLQQPSASRVAGIIERVGQMSWTDFAAGLEVGWRRDGYEVRRIDARGADLEMTRGGRKTLVLGRRWKVARTGVEPLRELVAARERLEADEILYIATGEVTAQARQFAIEKRIGLIQGPELARLLRGAPRRA